MLLDLVAFLHHIIITMHATHGVDSSHLPQNDGAVLWLKSWMRQHSGLVYMNCGNRLENTGNVLMRGLAWKYTRFTHPKDAFIGAVLTNIYFNTRTVVVAGSISNESDECISGVLRSRRWFLVDTIILEYEDDQSGRIRGLVAYRGMNSTGIEVSFLPQMISDGLETASVDSAERVSGKCTSFDSVRPGKWKSSLGGCEIRVGCMRLTRWEELFTSCKAKQYRVLLEALRAFNVTPKYQFYADYRSVAADFTFRQVDILLQRTGLDEIIFRQYAFPKIYAYRHETFYTWTGELEDSFFSTLINSNVVIGSLIAAFVVSWLALCFGEFIQFGRHFDGDLLIEFATLLVASFLAASAPIPRNVSDSRRWWCRKSRMTVIVVWMLGIFPLSFYLRGELTSRLTVRVPPNPIDTIAEFEEALEAGRLTPCMVRSSSLEFLFSTREEYRDISISLYIKLKVAFQTKSAGITFRHSNPFECLRLCATKPGHACVMLAHEDCPKNVPKGGYVESREPLRLFLSFSTVRKDFALAEAYDSLEDRIFETALNPYAFNSRRQCDRRLLGGKKTFEISEDNLGETPQYFKLSMFFATFSASLLFASIVFCVEVAIGSRR